MKDIWDQDEFKNEEKRLQKTDIKSLFALPVLVWKISVSEVVLFRFSRRIYIFHFPHITPLHGFSTSSPFFVLISSTNIDVPESPDFPPGRYLTVSSKR